MENNKSKAARVIPVVVIALWLVFYLGLGVYFYVAESVLPKKQYEEASALFAAEKYEEAYATLSSVEDFKDGLMLRERIERILVSRAEVGDVITFGKYDKKMHGRTDDVRWIVLEKQEDRVLVFSEITLGTMTVGRIPGEGAIEYATRRLPYVMEDDDKYEDGSWGASLMRGYLHKTLATKIMTESQIASLVETENPDRNTVAKDKLFLLSTEETKKYFPTETDRRFGSAWWLRSESAEAGKFCYVNKFGKICEGEDAKSVGEYLTIRPAMWIDISAAKG